METLWKTVTAQMSPIELIAAAALLINIYLVAKNNIWCWFWGSIAVTLYAYVFYTSKLYSSMGLQIFYYLPMQFYGWWYWRRGGSGGGNDLPIAVLPASKRVLWFAASIPLAIGLGYMMTFTGAQLTYLDALVTAMSIIAQYLMTHKFIENWAFWILVNVVYAFYVLPAQKLYISAGLYVILLGMATLGLVEWARIRQQERGQRIVRSLDQPAH